MGLEIYKIYLLVDIIKECGCFARQKTRTKIEELRDLSIEEFTNDYLQMTNLDTPPNKLAGRLAYRQAGNFPRLSASLLGGDRRRPCPSGRRGGQERMQREYAKDFTRKKLFLDFLRDLFYDEYKSPLMLFFMILNLPLFSLFLTIT